MDEVQLANISSFDFYLSNLWVAKFPWFSPVPQGLGSTHELKPVTLSVCSCIPSGLPVSRCHVLGHSEFPPYVSYFNFGNSGSGEKT